MIINKETNPELYDLLEKSTETFLGSSLLTTGGSIEWTPSDTIFTRRSATSSSSISVHDMEEDGTPFGFDFKMESEVNGTRRIIADPDELIKSDRLLKYIERLKHNLVTICRNFDRIDHIDCYMTSDVKEMIIKEIRRSKMYGKKPPVIARFDTFGNRLPDKLNLDVLNGVTLHILDPEKHGFLFLSFIATGDELTSSVAYDTLPF